MHIIPHDIIILEFLEERNLANGGTRYALVLRLETDLLERHDLVRANITRLVHDAVRAWYARIPVSTQSAGAVEETYLRLLRWYV